MLDCVKEADMDLSTLFIIVYSWKEGNKMAKKVKKRNEIKAEDTWRLEDIFATDEEWEDAYKEVMLSCDELKKWKGKVVASGKNLHAFMHLYEKTGILFGKVYVYAHQKYHQDTANATYQELSDRADTLLMQYQSATSFFQPEILGASEEQFEWVYADFMQWVDEKDKPGYDRFFGEILRQKEHRLSAEMEELLANARDVLGSSNTIFSMFNNADISFPDILDENKEKVAITHGRFSTLLQSRDRRVRKDAFEGLYSKYKEFENTLAATYSANVKKDIFIAKTRKYSSSLAMALDESDIPVAVYENLIQVVRQNLSLLHRYMRIRKKALQVEELHLYDVYVPMVEEEKKEISFEQAKKMVLEGLSPMGEEYELLLKKGFEHRWIDVYENKGKRSGAYSWGSYGTHPYVLLNHQDDLNSVFTIAHEMGHALHSYYSNSSQPYICADYEIFVAEVASTCNEALLIHDLLEKTTEKKAQAYLINYHLEQFRTTLFRQTMFAEFEWKAHQMAESGEALTAQSLSTMYHQLNVDYFGEDTVIDKEIDLEWARIPHFYNSFYVYQYATGYSAAIALSTKILKEGEPAVKDYINKFLRGGGSKDPIALLKGAGVDMSRKESIQSAMDVFETLLDQMEALL